MNLGYFHSLLSDLQNDLADTNVQALLKTLVNALSSQVNNPTDPAQQVAVGNAREQLLVALEESPISSYPENAKKALREFELDMFIPSHMEEWLEGVFQRNQITPQVALDQIQATRKVFDTDVAAIAAILDGLKRLSVETDGLEDGATEILVSIPRKFVDEDPSKLGEEFKKLEKLLRPFTELATGEFQPLKVRQISSSEFLIVFIVLAQLHYAAKVVKAVAEAVSAVIKIYKDVADLRVMKAKLAAMDGKSSKKAISELDNMAEKLVDAGIEAFAKELVDKYYKKRDAGRRAELVSHAKDSLKKIATRIDQGFDFETRAGALPPPPENEDGDDGEEGDAAEAPETPEAKELREALEAISEAHRTQLRFQRDGEPILGLPSPDKEGDADK